MFNKRPKNSKANDVIASKFVKAQGNGKGRNLNTHWENEHFYSYSTEVARFVTGKDNKQYCLISYNTMSFSTSRHIGNIIWACMNTNTPFLRVHAQWGDNSWGVNEKVYAERGLKDLQYFVNNQEVLRRKPNRVEFIRLYEYTREFIDHIETGMSIPKEVHELYNNMFDMTFLKQLKSRKVA